MEGVELSNEANRLLLPRRLTRRSHLLPSFWVGRRAQLWGQVLCTDVGLGFVPSLTLDHGVPSALKNQVQSRKNT